ncbi:hypothetical protein KL935_003415 [Ogataea polymorpha]|nr:hypothetical protein KL908_001905 [Ogataea polymorpha]KAG7899874.1 hypothetical protein KL935_003415 [Ogataea polymorpha]
MSNIRLALLRCTELQSASKRELALQWCLDLTTSMSRDKYRYSGLVPTLSRDRLRYIATQLQQFRRNISRTNTMFFEHNLKILAEQPSSSKLFEEAHDKVKQYIELKKTHSENEHENEKAELFDYLYKNRYESLIVKLFRDSVDRFAGLKESQFYQLTTIIDRYGTLEDLNSFLEQYGTKKTSHLLRRLDNLNKTQEISAILKFQESHDANLLYHIKNYRGLSLALTKYLRHQIWTCKSLEKKKAMAKTTLDILGPENCDVQFLAEAYRVLRSGDLKNRYELAKQLIDPHRKKDIIFAMLSDASPLESCYLWANEFPDIQLTNQIPKELYILKHRYLFAGRLPKNFVQHLDLDRAQLNKFISCLIFGYSRWGDHQYVFDLVKLKSQLGLEISIIDQVGIFLATLQLDQSNAYNAFKSLPQEAHRYVVKEVLEMLGKANRWDELNAFFSSLSRLQYTPTLEDYTVMFEALASRGATDPVLEIWEMFLRRGMTPTDRILQAVIKSHIKKQAYADCLQWFAAYSHFKIPLSPKAYGLMLQALSGTNELVACFQLLDELTKIKNAALKRNNFSGFLSNCANGGDHKSIETLLSVYYPKFGLTPEAPDFTWILRAHFNSQRYDTVIDIFRKLQDDKLDCYGSYEVALLSASRLGTLRTFDKLWAEFSGKYKDELKVESYEPFLIAYCRRHKFNSLVKFMDGLREHYGKFPTKLLNQVFFQYMRMGKLQNAFGLIGVALSRGLEISSKTYSLVLQAGTNLVSNFNASLMEELLNNKSKDSVGFAEKDLSPASFKSAIKCLLNENQTRKARSLFETYIETSSSYFLDNVHILALELMILGKENRWQEFDSCFNRYYSIVRQKIAHARLKNTEVYDKMDDLNFRLHTGSTLQTLDEIRLRDRSLKPGAIARYLREAVIDIWPYRLKQLVHQGQLRTIPQAVEQMLADGFVLSSFNINEAALKLSTDPSLVHETVKFIERYLLRDLMKRGRHRFLRLQFKSSMTVPPAPIRSSPLHFQLIMMNLTKHIKALPRSEALEVLRSPVLAKRDTVLRHRSHIQENFKKLRAKAILQTSIANKQTRIEAYNEIRTKRHGYIRSRMNEINEYSRLLNMLLRKISNSALKAKGQELQELQEHSKAYKEKLKQLQKAKAGLLEEAKNIVIDVRTKYDKKHMYNKMVETHQQQT